MTADDGNVVHVARFEEVRDHFDEMRNFTTHRFAKLRAEMRGEFHDVKANFGRVERRLDRHEELLGELLTEVRSLKPK